MADASASISLLIPKQNRDWRRKDPIQLKSMALRAVMESLTTILASEKNYEANKSKCEDFKQELPREIFFDLVEYSKKSMLKPLQLISILETAPSCSYIKDIDFIGKYRGTHSCSSSNNFMWINGVATQCLLGLDVLTRLFMLVDAEDKRKVTRIALWTKKNVLIPSNFPRIIAQATMLTSLTLRGDADDHILRIIGLNCDFLKHLDVSRSPKITQQGLRKLFLKKYKTKNPIEAPKNKIAESINTFTVTTGEDKPLSKASLFSFAKVFSSSSYYIHCAVPDYTITIDRFSKKIEMTLDQCFERTNLRLLRDIQSLVPVNPANPDEVEIDIMNPDVDDYILKMFNKETRLLRKILKVKLDFGIVELVEYWESRIWPLSELIDIADFALQAPNIQKMCCRISGSWEESWGTLFPKLEEIDCWCLYENCTRSILRHCPALRLVNIRHVPEANGAGLLTDPELHEILEMNNGLKTGVEEFNIQPTNLTKNSVLEIHRQCPKVRRIGDLECWNIQNEDINEINQFLYKANSQCVLVVLDYPPRL